jgi:hypothetical protein
VQAAYEEVARDIVNSVDGIMAGLGGGGFRPALPPIIPTGTEDRIATTGAALDKLHDRLRQISEFWKDAGQLKSLLGDLDKSVLAKGADPKVDRMAEAAREFEESQRRAEENARRIAEHWNDVQDSLFTATRLLDQIGLRGLGNITNGVSEMVRGLRQLREAQGTISGVPSLAAAIPGIIGIAGGAFAIGQQLFGGDPQRDALLKGNTDALNRLADDLRGAVSFGERSQAAALLDFTGGGLLASLQLARSGNLDQLARVAESLGIDILNDQGQLVTEALDQLRQALRLSALSVEQFGRTIEGQRRLLDARRDIFEIDDPVAAIQDAYTLLLQGLSEAAEVQFGLVGLDLSTGAGQQALEEGLRELFSAFQAGELPDSMLEGFSSVDDFLRAILGADNALDKLADTTNRLNQSVINMAPGYRLAHRVWQVQDPREWLPLPGGGATTGADAGGAVTLNIPLTVTGGAAPDARGTYRALYEEWRQQARANPAMLAWFNTLTPPS